MIVCEDSSSNTGFPKYSCCCSLVVPFKYQWEWVTQGNPNTSLLKNPNFHVIISLLIANVLQSVFHEHKYGEYKCTLHINDHSLGTRLSAVSSISQTVYPFSSCAFIPHHCIKIKVCLKYIVMFIMYTLKWPFHMLVVFRCTDSNWFPPQFHLPTWTLFF